MCTYSYIYLFAVYYYVKQGGAHVAVINGYTFYCHNKGSKISDRWPCSSSSSKSCKAYFVATKSREIIRANVNHNHAPTKFVVVNGILMKIWNYSEGRAGYTTNIELRWNWNLFRIPYQTIYFILNIDYTSKITHTHTHAQHGHARILETHYSLYLHVVYINLS